MRNEPVDFLRFLVFTRQTSPVIPVYTSIYLQYLIVEAVTSKYENNYLNVYFLR